jgi:hypothetical protein
MPEPMNCRIEVEAMFGGRTKLRPLWFFWNKRKYQIKEVTYGWMTKEGKATIYHFSVKDENDNLFEITYNNESLVWKVLSVEE